MAVTVVPLTSDERVPAPPGWEHELVLVRRGRRTGIPMTIAVHSTALGPALGGCRMWHYASLELAIADARRLSRAMTLKAAAAGLDLGGGKSVIALPEGPAPDGELRRSMLADFADALNLLGGLYITAEDVGSSPADMAQLSELTDHVVGRPSGSGGSGDPGDFTAAGVQAAIRACCLHSFGSADAAGRTVSVVGVGHVGEPLARRLAKEGAKLVLADVDPAHRALADELGANWLEPDLALRAPVDVLAPCALGGVIDEALAEQLRCSVVCGSANNQLADDALAERLAGRGILYAPDFIANAGGLINVSLELTGYDRSRAADRAVAIEQVMDAILLRAEQDAITPLAAALALAEQRLQGAAAPHAG